MIDLWESLIRTAAALGIVLLLMGLLALVARRVMGSRPTVPGPGPLVQVLGSGYIGPRKTITLVSVAGEYLIVGTTATELVPLGRIDDSGKLQAVLASGSAVSPHPVTPSAMLASWFQHLPLGRKGRHGEE